MGDTREATLAASLVERMKAALDEALEDEDYTNIVEMADGVLGEDEEAEDLFALIDDGSSVNDSLDDDFDDLDSGFDDEDEDDELSFDDDEDDEDDDDEDE